MATLDTKTLAATEHASNIYKTSPGHIVDALAAWLDDRYPINMAFNEKMIKEIETETSKENPILMNPLTNKIATEKDWRFSTKIYDVDFNKIEWIAVQTDKTSKKFVKTQFKPSYANDEIKAFYIATKNYLIKAALNEASALSKETENMMEKQEEKLASLMKNKPSMFFSNPFAKRAWKKEVDGYRKLIADGKIILKKDRELMRDRPRLAELLAEEKMRRAVPTLSSRYYKMREEERTQKLIQQNMQKTQHKKERAHGLSR
ncbi:MAG: hypothetical protein LBU76_06100 [Azoarcus sp.]|jgi:hypothetical protein|nr:hypothetical protein [Azoarcus sp.]